MKYESKKSSCFILAAIFLTVFVVTVQASPGSMSRTVSPSVVLPGGMVTVTLTVDVEAGERYYIIDETPPPELAVVETGGLVKDESKPDNVHLKIVQLQDAADRTFIYTITAPAEEGTYTFSGIYQVDGMENEGVITGDSAITVSSAAGGMNTLTIVAVLVVVVLGVVVAFLYFKK